MPAIAERVDALFQNAPVPTKTETERAFVLGFMSMLGNVQFLITSICSAVIFAIVLVAANTMAMSIRERVREIGVLKTLGFYNDRILFLLMGESLLLSLGGTLLGALGARAVYSRLDMATLTSGFLLRLDVNPKILLTLHCHRMRRWIVGGGSTRVARVTISGCGGSAPRSMKSSAEY